MFDNNKFIFSIFFIIFSSMAISQTIEELEKLKSEYKDVLNRQSLQKSKDVTDAEQTASSTALPDKLIYSRKDVESLLINTEKLLKKLKVLQDSIVSFPYVGYDIFTKRDTFPFWQNLPIPKNYNLGPGDEVIISLWGETESYNSKVINRDGQIFLDNIGILNLGGKTVIDAKKYIVSKYSKVYSTLLGNSPTTFVDITLGELKSINVHFVGFVNLPGIHMIHPFSNVITGLNQSGGINDSGSLRNINIIRSGSLIASIDIYDYIFYGRSISDIRLLDQDIIYVPPRLSTVPISGKVKKPGYYELIDNETVFDLVNYAGGFEVNSSNKVFIYKNDFNNEESSSLLDKTNLSKYIIFNGDSLYVPQKPDKDYFVVIDGQIKNPGKYPYHSGLDLKELIEATMSTEDKDFIKTSDLSKIMVNRKNPSGKFPINFIVNLNNDNIRLHNGDYITIPKTMNNQSIESIKITGEVNSPGVYPVNNSTTLFEILDMTGGYTSSALKDGIEVFRDTLKIAWDNKNFILNDGDSINVVKKSGLVLVEGEVNTPGYIIFKKGDTVKDYIKYAGGYNSFADKKNIFILYPNGMAKPLTRWSSPKVIEGSKIIVNQRTISGEKTLSSLDAFQSITTVTSNLASTLVTVILLINQTSN